MLMAEKLPEFANELQTLWRNNLVSLSPLRPYPLSINAVVAMIFVRHSTHFRPRKGREAQVTKTLFSILMMGWLF
jgi:hypothetical protein